MSHIEKLLCQDESDWLDIKQEQYLFAGAANYDGAELLRDILAFANSWRNVDGYILIGLEEVNCSIPHIENTPTVPMFALSLLPSTTTN